MPEPLLFESGSYGQTFLPFIIRLLLILRRREVADRLEQARGIKPVHPFERGVLHLVESLPGTAAADHFSLEKPVDRLGQCVVIGIAD